LAGLVVPVRGKGLPGPPKPFVFSGKPKNLGKQRGFGRVSISAYQKRDGAKNLSSPARLGRGESALEKGKGAGP